MPRNPQRGRSPADHLWGAEGSVRLVVPWEWHLSSRAGELGQWAPESGIVPQVTLYYLYVVFQIFFIPVSGIVFSRNPKPNLLKAWWINTMILDPGKTSLSATLNAVLKALNLYAHDVIRIRIRIKDKDRIRIRLKWNSCSWSALKWFASSSVGDPDPDPNPHDSHGFVSNGSRQCCGTGTVINYGSWTGTRHKILYLISFIKLFFHSHLTKHLLKFRNFFLLKQLTK